jgi:hypothetical protein
MSKKALFAILGSISCSTISGDSNLDGSNYAEIVEYERSNGNVSVRPDYVGLGSLDAKDNKTRVLTLGIIITFDGKVNADGSNIESDTGTQAYNDIKSWLSKPSDQGGLLEPNLDSNNDGKPDKIAKIVDSTVNQNARIKEFKIEGHGRDLWLVKEEVYWKITVTLGYITEVHHLFGESIANNDITMLNGHFYRNEVQNDVNENNFMQQFFGNSSGRKGIYPQAMDTFKSKYNENSNPYKIVVVNGCKSELIEEIIIDAAKTINQGKPESKQLKIDMIGHRGFSNFNHFGPQITSFISGLVKSNDDNNRKPTDWKTLITALTFNRAADPATVKIDPSLSKVEPVLRRFPSQLTATTQDQAKGSQL